MKFAGKWSHGFKPITDTLNQLSYAYTGDIRYVRGGPYRDKDGYIFNRHDIRSFPEREKYLRKHGNHLIMAKRKSSTALTVYSKRQRNKLREALGADPTLPPLGRSGETRVVGYYGRYNNPENRTVENKFFDTTLSFTFDSTGEVPATGQLCLIPQGTEGDERIGRKTTIHSIQIRGRMTYDPLTSGNGTAQVYFYLVQDKQCNGTAAAITDVLTTNSMAGAMINMANSSRFRILKRFVWTFNATGGVEGAWGPMQGSMDYFKKCNIPVEFSSTTGALTEIKSNNIFLLAGASSLADDATAFAGTCRLRFSD